MADDINPLPLVKQSNQSEGVTRLSGALAKVLGKELTDAFDRAYLNDTLDQIQRNTLAMSNAAVANRVDPAKSKEEAERNGIAAGRILAETFKGVILANLVTSVAKSAKGQLTGEAVNANAGAKVFGGALSVLANTVGTALVPVFVVLAAGALSVSDYLTEKLLPNLEKWADAVFNFADRIGGTVDKITTGYDKGWEWIKQVNNSTKPIHDSGVVDRVNAGISASTAAPFNASSDEISLIKAALGQAKPDVEGGAWGWKMIANAKPIEDGGGSPSGGGGSRFQRAMKDILVEMRRGQGSPASFGSLADASRQAQLAAFGSPFERRMLQMTERMLSAMEKTAGNTAKNNNGFKD
jgi:hypothetical protein